MFDKLFPRRQPDPDLQRTLQVFEEHSAELMSSAKAFVENNLGQAGADSDGSGAVYAGFVRFRKDSLARKLLADQRVQELQEELERRQAVQLLAQRYPTATSPVLPPQTVAVPPVVISEQTDTAANDTDVNNSDNERSA